MMARPGRFTIPVLALGLLCTGAVTAGLWNAARWRDEERFRTARHDSAARIHDRLASNVALLRGAAGLFAATRLVTADEFEAFVERLDLPTRYPGLRGLGFSLRGPDEATLNEAIRLRWEVEGESFEVWPRAEGERHTIVFLEPRDERNRRAMGFDMFLNPVRREAMSRARDTGEPAMSGLVTLVQEVEGEDPQPGFLIYLPVYTGGRTPETVEARRQALVGFVYLPFRAHDLFEAIFPHGGLESTALRVHDGPTTADTLLYAAEDWPARAGMEEDLELAFAGRRWTLHFATLPSFADASFAWIAPMSAAAGLAATGLFAWIVWHVESARRAAEESRLGLRTTLESIADAVIATDASGLVTFMNPVAERLTGWRAAEARGRPASEVFEIFEERTGEREANPIERVLRGGVAVGLSDHTELRTRDGRRAPIDDSAAPIFGASGRVAGAVLVFRDVSERRRAEGAVRTQARVLESMAEGVCLADERGTIQYTNPALDRMFGYEPGELIGRRVTALNDLPVDENERVVSSVIEELRGSGEWRNRRKDGSVFFTRAQITRLDLGGRPHWVCVQEDVTEAKRAEAARQESEARFRVMADSAPVLVWMAGPDGRCVWFNRAWLEFTGRTLEEEVGEGWTGGVHPEDAGSCKAALRGAFEGRSALETKHRLRRRDGQFRWILNRGVPLFGPDGSFAGHVGSCVDITDIERARESLERQSAELERLVAERTAALAASHERLRHAERLASLGTLAAGIGHDLGNLLLPVRVRLESIKQHEGRNEDAEAIEKSIEYLGQLAQGLRLLARDPASAPDTGEPTDLAEWWSGVSRLMASPLARGVTLESRIPEGLARVSMGRTALTQAVFNLVQNASDAMRGRGSGRIVVWAEEDGSGARVRLGVTDDGPGMTADVRARCLEPFFSTKPRNISTGMGLSFVAGLAGRAGGEIEIESAPGRGATFVLSLPVAVRAGRSGPAAAVSVADARLRALVELEVRRLGGTAVRVGPGEAAPGGEDVWIVDGSARGEQVARYVAGGHSRRVIVLGPSPAGAGPRVRSIAPGGRLSEVRQELASALVEMREPAGAGAREGVHGAGDVRG